MKLKEGQEILIEVTGQKFLVTPNPHNKNTMELRKGNEKDGYDVVEIIETLDEVLKYI